MDTHLSKLAFKPSRIVLLSVWLFLLLFEGLSKWLYSIIYHDDIVINPNANLPSAIEWIFQSLLWPRVWIRATLCALIYTWLLQRIWIRLKKVGVLLKALILLLLLFTIITVYQLLLYRPFSIERLKLFQPELLCFSLIILLYYTPIALALTWLLTHLHSKKY